jgi:hypothetical protein
VSLDVSGSRLADSHPVQPPTERHRNDPQIDSDRARGARRGSARPGLGRRRRRQEGSAPSDLQGPDLRQPGHHLVVPQDGQRPCTADNYGNGEARIQFDNTQPAKVTAYEIKIPPTARAPSSVARLTTAPTGTAVPTGTQPPRATSSRSTSRSRRRSCSTRRARRSSSTVATSTVSTSPASPSADRKPARSRARSSPPGS